MKPSKTHNSPMNVEEMTDDEEEASPPASEEDEELGEEEEDVEEMEEDGPEPDGENSASEASLDQSNSDRHPYPTPPPDDGSKMAKPKAEVAKKKVPYINLAIMAIEKLNERSGSSVMAIMKYLKENGHPWQDMKRQHRRMTKILKVAVDAGQLIMIKRSFKISESSKKAHAAVEKMKAKKAKLMAKEKEKQNLKKDKDQKKKEKAKEKDNEKAMKKAAKKAEKNEPTKGEKPGKPSERKTKQATKKKKVEDGVKDVPPKAKTAASVAARALLNTPTNDEQPAKKEVKANTSESGKVKKPRKSIGTLAQAKTVKPNVKAVKKLVAAKTVAAQDDVEISQAQATSTPTGPLKGKRMRKV